MTTEAYHTALSSGHMHDAPPIERVEFQSAAGASVALRHDLMSAPLLPAEFDEAEVVYGDPPWPQGFSRFNERAGIADGRVYAGLMGRLGFIIRHTDKPFVMVAGKTALRHLPKATAIYPTQLNGAAAVAVAYRTRLSATGSAVEIVHELAGRFGVIGDCFCGYGRTARIAAAAGKRFVVSDYNAHCIGYIAKHAPSWLR